MDLFCFASRTSENIRRGVEAKTWAVSSVSSSARRGRVTKSRKMAVGSKGILYCSPTHSFTTPFIVASEADPNHTVKDIWPEAWELPFGIEPLGDLSRQLSAQQAQMFWPVVQRRLEPGGSISAAMNLTGVTVFVPVEITEEDWTIILRDLATRQTPTPPR